MYLRKRFRHMNWPLLFLPQQKLTNLQGRLLKGGHRCPYGFPSSAPACLPACMRAAITQKRAPKGSSSSSKNQPPNRVRVCTSENSKCTYVRFLSLQSLVKINQCLVGYFLLFSNRRILGQFLSDRTM
jgi:hypothetical protein